MPTPPVKSASTITHLTAGTFQPYSIEAEAILRISAIGRPPFSGVKPTSRISRKATKNITTSTTARSTNGTPRFGRRRGNRRPTEPVSIAAPPTICPRLKTDSSAAGETGRVERVHQPGLDRAGEEGIAEPEQERDQPPTPKG